MRHLLTILLFSVVVADCRAQVTLTVPSPPYPTIQSAVGAAAPYDVIEVQPGIYFESLLIQVAVRLVAVGGYQATTIDGGGASDVILISGAFADVTIEGFTIQNGVDGVDLSGNSQGVIRSCRVTAAANCGIDGTSGSTSVTVEGCLVDACGVGIDVRTIGTVRNTTVRNCGVAVNYGGSSLDVDACDLIDNFGSGVASGLAVVSADAGSVLVTNTLFAANHGTDPEVGVTAPSSVDIKIVSCTIVSMGPEASVEAQPPSTLELRNSIIRGGGGIIDAGGIAVVDHCNVEGGWSGAGAGNIDADPLFVDQPNGDFHLFAQSPCVNAGDDTVPELPLQDRDGDPRIIGAATDIGFDEVSLPPASCLPGLSSSLRFDGVDDWVQIPNDSSLDGFLDFTIEFWVRTSATQRQSLIKKWELNGSKSYSIEVNPAGQPGTGILEYGFFGVAGGVVFFSTVSVNDGSWHHVAVTRSGANIQTFVDGTPDATASFSPGLSGATAALTLGAGSLSGGAPEPGVRLDGWLDEVRIWDVYRTQSEIISSMNSGVTASSPDIAGYWRLDSASGQVVTDLSGNENHGVLGGAVTVDSEDPTWDLIDVAPIQYCNFPGSSEDFMLSTGVNGPVSRYQDTKSISAGDVLGVVLDSPFGAYHGKVPVIAAQGFLTGSSPSQLPGYPEIWLDPLPTAPLPIAVLYDGWAAPFAPGALPPGGLSLGFTMPPFPAGLSIMIQGFALSPSSNTGHPFTTTDGHELRIL